MVPNSIVVPYDPGWKVQFGEIREQLWPQLDSLLVGFEHVGSTSVPGLPAKPVIDIDAIYRDPQLLPEIIRRLEMSGYKYEGNKGIEGRESFLAPSGIRHNLYVCTEGCLALKNHILFRDHLLNSPKDRDDYGKLKLQIASLYEVSASSYVEAKTEFILKILSQYEISASDLAAIQAANRAK